MNNRSSFTTVEVLFLASLIGLDFAYGLVVGPLLSATGILEIIRIDMVVPIMMMLVARLVVDRFGTLIVYEFVWVILAILAKPSSFGLPGFLKLFPALAYGLILDTLMSVVPGRLYVRLVVTAVVGGVVNHAVLMGFRVLLGMPWSTAVQVLFGINLVTTAVVNVIGAHLAFLVWNGIERAGWASRLKRWRTT